MAKKRPQFPPQEGRTYPFRGGPASSVEDKISAIEDALTSGDLYKVVAKRHGISKGTLSSLVSAYKRANPTDKRSPKYERIPKKEPPKKKRSTSGNRQQELALAGPTMMPPHSYDHPVEARPTLNGNGHAADGDIAVLHTTLRRALRERDALRTTLDIVMKELDVAERRIDEYERRNQP